MNPFEMVVIIVAIVMIASVMRGRMHKSGRERDPGELAENIRLREEVKDLKQRLQVLERIATDRENSLSQQIEELRDR